MKPGFRTALAGVLFACVVAVPAAAGISPYVRLDYGGNELRMTDLDQAIMRVQKELRADGYPASFQRVGSAYGFGGAAGFWLTSGFRLGATYSYQKAYRQNLSQLPGTFSWEDDEDLRIREVGGEAVLRFARLGGFTVGANMAQGRGQMTEGTRQEGIAGTYYLDATAERTLTTYGGFVGFDQTNPGGVAGYVHLGFQYRDMGHMREKYTESDGVSSVTSNDQTLWMDYSGLYLKVGTGFDLVR